MKTVAMYPTQEPAGDPDRIRRFILAVEALGFDYIAHFDHVVKVSHADRDSYYLMKELVESGLGFTILPHCAFGREAAAGRLTFARIREPAIKRQLFFAMRSDAGWPRAILRIETFIRQEIASLVQQGAWSGARLFNVGEN